MVLLYTHNYVCNAAKSRKLLLVGAGGIGCEVLKCLAQAGFKDITVVDLDTIDVSNLHRQFLFRKTDVRQSKAEVAKNKVLRVYPDMNITAYCESIMDEEFNVKWFKKFTAVINALDNIPARMHVNRMCLAADVPLIETGSTGYRGQVWPILKNLTPCYECTEHDRPKTYPSCTIRNTPTEMIHCIVWSKHLFAQLFGKTDDEAEVSPDTADPELADPNTGAPRLPGNSVEAVDIQELRFSTRKWAKEYKYNAEKLFNKFFCEDIKYLLSMKSLWEKRKRGIPKPLSFDEALKMDEISEYGNIRHHEYSVPDQRPWTIAECARIFEKSCELLYAEFINQNDPEVENVLYFDKDDKAKMDFVAACSNLRAHIFGIGQKTRYDIKSMAGNIIPAIGTVNCMVAGIVVYQLLKIINDQKEQCSTIFLREGNGPSGKFLVNEAFINQQNPACLACSIKPEVTLYVDLSRMTVQMLEEEVVKGRFHLTHPEVTLAKTGSIIIGEDCDFGDTHKLLKDFKIGEGSYLIVSDYVQEYTFSILVKEEIEPFSSDGKTEVYRIQIDNMPKANSGVKGEENVPTTVDGAKRSLDNGDDLPDSKKPRLDE